MLHFIKKPAICFALETSQLTCSGNDLTGFLYDVKTGLKLDKFEFTLITLMRSFLHDIPEDFTKDMV